MRKEKSSGQRVESVHRALVLLKLLSEEGSLSVTEAATALDIHPATAQRLLATLVGDDFARQGEKRRYFAGPALIRPSQQTISLRDRLHPYLQQLFALTGETVHVGVLIGTEVHHPDGIESTQPLRFGLRVGIRVPAHSSSEGKSMLADLLWEEVEARYSVALAGRHASGMNVDLKALRTELERVREQGFATNFEESEPGIAAASVSLGRTEGQHAAVSVAMPIARYSDEFGISLLGHLESVRREILAELSQ